MENEFNRMQKLAGVPVTKTKKQLDENFVGMSAINSPFIVREKAGYETAFEHYMGNIKEDMYSEAGEEMGAEEMGEENPIDAIMMDVPLFIRMLEYAREDASNDMDLHDLAEKAIAMSAEGEVLSMGNYEDLVGGEAEELNEGESKFFVYANHTPEGKYIKIAKTLAKNLTRDEAKDFIKKNQSKYKAPLSYTEDRRDMFGTNAGEEEFPTPY